MIEGQPGDADATIVDEPGEDGVAAGDPGEQRGVPHSAAIERPGRGGGEFALELFPVRDGGGGGGASPFEFEEIAMKGAGGGVSLEAVGGGAMTLEAVTMGLAGLIEATLGSGEVWCGEFGGAAHAPIVELKKRIRLDVDQLGESVRGAALFQVRLGAGNAGVGTNRGQAGIVAELGVESFGAIQLSLGFGGITEAGSEIGQELALGGFVLIAPGAGESLGGGALEEVGGVGEAELIGGAAQFISELHEADVLEGAVPEGGQTLGAVTPREHDGAGLAAVRELEAIPTKGERVEAGGMHAVRAGLKNGECLGAVAVDVRADGLLEARLPVDPGVGGGVRIAGGGAGDSDTGFGFARPLQGIGAFGAGAQDGGLIAKGRGEGLNFGAGALAGIGVGAAAGAKQGDERFVEGGGRSGAEIVAEPAVVMAGPLEAGEPVEGARGDGFGAAGQPFLEGDGELLFGVGLIVGKRKKRRGVFDDARAELGAAVDGGFGVAPAVTGFLGPGARGVLLEVAGPGVAGIRPEVEAFEGVGEVEESFERIGLLLNGARVEVEREGMIEGTFEAITAGEIGVGEFQQERRIVGREIASTVEGGDGVIPAAVEQIELAFEADSGGLVEIENADAGFGFEQRAGLVERIGESAGLTQGSVGGAGPAGGKGARVLVGLAQKQLGRGALAE